jgi:hypothetical protein
MLCELDLDADNNQRFDFEEMVMNQQPRTEDIEHSVHEFEEMNELPSDLEYYDPDEDSEKPRNFERRSTSLTLF